MRQHFARRLCSFPFTLRLRVPSSQLSTLPLLTTNSSAMLLLFVPVGAVNRQKFGATGPLNNNMKITTKSKSKVGALMSARRFTRYVCICSLSQSLIKVSFQVIRLELQTATRGRSRYHFPCASVRRGLCEEVTLWNGMTLADK